MPETPKELLHEVAKVPEEIRHEVVALEHEAEVGESARTPAIALGGITLVIAAALVAVALFTYLAYYLA